MSNYRRTERGNKGFEKISNPDFFRLKRAADAGVEGFISGHSLRIGSAVSLTQAGSTVVDMQVAGRWKSSQRPAHYAKAELTERGAIARFKDGNTR